jgi:DNA-binding response OmpR family regulator
MEQSIRLLLIEDDATDAELIAREFTRYGMECDWRRVDTEARLIEEIEAFRPDVIVSDFALPKFDGITALRISRALAPEVPFLFFSGALPQQQAIEFLRRGAMDYVMKDNLARIVPAVERVLREMRSKIDLRRMTQRLRDILATAQDWIWELDAAKQIVFAGSVAQDLLGKTAESLKNVPFGSLVVAEDRGLVERGLDELVAKPTGSRFTARFIRDEHIVSLESLAVATFDRRGALSGFRGSSREVLIR